MNCDFTFYDDGVLVKSGEQEIFLYERDTLRFINSAGGYGVLIKIIPPAIVGMDFALHEEEENAGLYE